MTAHPFSEDQLVEQPAIALLAELGWVALNGSHEVFGPQGTLGRPDTRCAVLPQRLMTALARLNPAVPPEAIAAAADEMMRDRSAMPATAANRELWALLRDGVAVAMPDPERGGQKTERLLAVD